MNQTIVVFALGALAAASTTKPAVPEDKCFEHDGYPVECDDQWNAFLHYCWTESENDSRCQEADDRYYADDREWRYPTDPEEACLDWENESEFADAEKCKTQWDLVNDECLELEGHMSTQWTDICDELMEYYYRS